VTFAGVSHPTAQWLARQMTEAFPWALAPTHLVRDNDRAHGQIFTGRLAAMGIRDRPINPGMPWQNGIAERLIGTLRRECLDHVVVFGEQHLRRVLSTYAVYYNQTRPHRSLQKDAAICRAAQRSHCRYPDPRRATSSIRPDVISGKDRCRQAQQPHRTVLWLLLVH
jgi:transposase InsO family protein